MNRIVCANKTSFGKSITFVAVASGFAMIAPAAIAEEAPSAKVVEKMSTPDAAAKPAPAAPAAAAETSDRTPGKKSPTPLVQQTSPDGKTSDRTPENHGEAAPAGPVQPETKLPDPAVK